MGLMTDYWILRRAIASSPNMRKPRRRRPAWVWVLSLVLAILVTSLWLPHVMEHWNG